MLSVEITNTKEPILTKFQSNLTDFCSTMTDFQSPLSGVQSLSSTGRSTLKDFGSSAIRDPSVPSDCRLSVSNDRSTLSQK